MIDNHRHPFLCGIFMWHSDLPPVILTAGSCYKACCCDLLYLRESQHILKNFSENIKNAFHV